MREPKTISETAAMETKATTEAPVVSEPAQSAKADKLVALGGKRWTKGDMDRVYLDGDALAAVLGIRVARYSSGQIKAAYNSDGDKISNNAAWKMLSGRPYYDVKADRFVDLGGPVAIAL